MQDMAWQMHQRDDTRLRAFLYGPDGDALPSELSPAEIAAADEDDKLWDIMWPWDDHGVDPWVVLFRGP